MLVQMSERHYDSGYNSYKKNLDNDDASSDDENEVKHSNNNRNNIQDFKVSTLNSAFLNSLREKNATAENFNYAVDNMNEEDGYKSTFKNYQDNATFYPNYYHQRQGDKIFIPTSSNYPIKNEVI